MSRRPNSELGSCEGELRSDVVRKNAKAMERATIREIWRKEWDRIGRVAEKARTRKVQP